MRPLTALAMAWRAVIGHRLRSALTALGIVIGVAAVIALVTLGGSLQASIVADVGAEQADAVYVWAAPGETGGPVGGGEPVFTERDVDALRALSAVEDVVPVGPVRTTALTHRGDTVSRASGVLATAPAYLATADLREGRGFEQGASEAVLNPAAAAAFDDEVSLGDELTLTLAGGETRTATVVGVVNDSEPLSPFEGFGQAPRVYLPTDPFYQTRLVVGGTVQAVYPGLVLEATGVEAVDAATTDARAYLAGESDAGTLVPGDHEFRLQTVSELLDQVRSILDTLTGFVTGIAVISLVVASIGIANIMLVSVTERTREIGIMKAVGAQNRAVLGLFLAEAVILGLVGAVLGVLVGVAAAVLAADYVGIPVAFDPVWIAVAVGVGVLVGVVAGLYPAWRAARTDPIDALRYE